MVNGVLGELMEDVITNVVEVYKNDSDLAQIQHQDMVARYVKEKLNLFEFVTPITVQVRLKECKI